MFPPCFLIACFPPTSPPLPPHPRLLSSLPLSLSERAAPRITGAWSSIRNMCGGLEEADGKSSVKRLALIYSKEPQPVGITETFWLFTGYYFHWMDKQEKEKHLTLKLLRKIQEPVGNLIPPPSHQNTAVKMHGLRIIRSMAMCDNSRCSVWQKGHCELTLFGGYSNLCYTATLWTFTVLTAHICSDILVWMFKINYLFHYFKCSYLRKSTEVLFKYFVEYWSKSECWFDPIWHV